VEALAGLPNIVSAALAGIANLARGQTVVGAISGAIAGQLQAATAGRRVTPSELRQVAYNLATQHRAGTLGQPPAPPAPPANRRVRVDYEVEREGQTRRYVAVSSLPGDFTTNDALDVAETQVEDMSDNGQTEFDRTSIMVMMTTDLGPA
jgi:hypothetical protein